MTKSTKVMMNVMMVMIAKIAQVRRTSNARVSNPTHRQTTQIFLDSTGIVDWRRIGIRAEEIKSGKCDDSSIKKLRKVTNEILGYGQ